MDIACPKYDKVFPFCVLIKPVGLCGTQIWTWRTIFDTPPLQHRSSYGRNTPVCGKNQIGGKSRIVNRVRNIFVHFEYHKD